MPDTPNAIAVAPRGTVFVMFLCLFWCTSWKWTELKDNPMGTLGRLSGLSKSKSRVCQDPEERALPPPPQQAGEAAGTGIKSRAVAIMARFLTNGDPPVHRKLGMNVVEVASQTLLAMKRGEVGVSAGNQIFHFHARARPLMVPFSPSLSLSTLDVPLYVHLQ